MLRTVIIVALATFSSAQIAGLSSQCLGALSGIVADPDASACLKPNDLISLATLPKNASIVPTLDTWTKDVCSAAPCSNATLANVIKIIVTGCQAELSDGTQGVDPNTIASSITPKIQQFYPTVRKVLCLKHGDTMCDTELLQNIQTTVGQNITVSNFLNMIQGGVNLGNIPKNITCSDCIKAAYTTINEDVPSLTSDAAPAFQSQCGASFTDGTIPSSISNSAAAAADASPSPSGTPNGASTLVSSGFSILGLTVISTMIRFF